jgi:hypothetical protein
MSSYIASTGQTNLHEWLVAGDCYHHQYLLGRMAYAELITCTCAIGVDVHSLSNVMRMPVLLMSETSHRTCRDDDSMLCTSDTLVQIFIHSNPILDHRTKALEPMADDVVVVLLHRHWELVHT